MKIGNQFVPIIFEMECQYKNTSTFQYIRLVIYFQTKHLKNIMDYGVIDREYSVAFGEQTLI